MVWKQQDFKATPILKLVKITKFSKTIGTSPGIPPPFTGPGYLNLEASPPGGSAQLDFFFWDLPSNCCLG